MKRIILLLSLWSLAIRLPAQESWTLERCIQYGKEHSLSLREQAVETAVRKAVLLEKTAAFLPVVNATLVQDWNWGRSVDMQELVIIRNKLTQATGASLSATLSLFEGFSRFHERRSAAKSLESALLDGQALQRTLTIEITRAYLQLMLSRQVERVARENHAAIVLQRERTAHLVEAGSQPGSALSEMDAQVAAEKAAAVEASCQVRTAILALSRLMNLPAAEELPAEEAFVDEEIIRQVPALTRTQIEDWLWQDPRIRSARAAIQASEQLQKAVRGTYLPHLRLSAGYGSYYSSAAEGSFRSQLSENQNPSLSLQLVVPVFDALQRNAQVRRTKLDLEQARLLAEKKRIQAEEDIRSAAIEAENCCQKYLSAEETLRAMQERLAITEAKYNLGATSALDYITARNHHAKALSDFLQAKWQYLFQLKLLEQYRR
ncbi:MAG: TolC family protein [Bacteroidales bacterium]|nr:TolC family protein [Bacteroidales bacterium]